MNKHRDAKLAEEIYYVVLRLLQLRNIYATTKSGLKISSVKYQGKELGWFSCLAHLGPLSRKVKKVL